MLNLERIISTTASSLLLDTPNQPTISFNGSHALASPVTNQGTIAKHQNPSYERLYARPLDEILHSIPPMLHF